MEKTIKKKIVTNTKNDILRCYAKCKTLIDIYLGGLIEHSNIKGDGDHNVNDRDYSIRDPVDWATRIQIRDKRLI